MRNWLLAGLLAVGVMPAWAAEAAIGHESPLNADPLSLQIKLQQSRGQEPQTIVAVRDEGGRPVAVPLVTPVDPLSEPKPVEGLRASRAKADKSRGKQRAKAPRKQAEAIERHPESWESGR